MTKERAIEEATREATKNKIRMAVTFNPYGEEEAEEERFGYFPLSATRIFKYEEVVRIVEP